MALRDCQGKRFTDSSSYNLRLRNTNKKQPPLASRFSCTSDYNFILCFVSARIMDSLKSSTMIRSPFIYLLGSLLAVYCAIQLIGYVLRCRRFDAANPHAEPDERHEAVGTLGLHDKGLLLGICLVVLSLI
jgi:hypothetical protein